MAGVKGGLYLVEGDVSRPVQVRLTGSGGLLVGTGCLVSGWSVTGPDGTGAYGVTVLDGLDTTGAAVAYGLTAVNLGSYAVQFAIPLLFRVGVYMQLDAVA